ncbi:hypothetical protein K0U83_03685, partial [bacterium]|nr:hypothetical protein [bacterium]
DSLLGYAKRKSDEVGAAHAGDAQSLTDAWDGKTSWGDFLANAAGYVAGQAIQSILTGGAGAIGARMLANNGIKQIGVKVAAEQIAAGATEEIAKTAALKAMTEAGSKAAVRGGIAGATAQNLNMELGSIYPEAVDEAGGADKLDNGDRFRVMSAAALAAGVDTAGEALTAFKWLKGSTAGGKGILGRAAREVPAGMAREAGTEAIQTGIEQWGADKALDVRDIVDSAGIGAVGGALAGGGASLRKREAEKPPEPKPGVVAAVLAAPDVDTAIKEMAEGLTGAKKPAPAELPQMDAEDRREVLGLMQVVNRPGVSPNVARFAQARMDALLAPYRSIPTGEATEMLPVADARELTDEERAEYANAAPFSYRRAMARGLPQPEVTEVLPTGDATEVEPIPAGDAFEEIPAPEAYETLPTGEVSDLIPTADATEFESVPAGDTAELDVETIQPTDLMARDGQPFGSKTGAQAKAYASGGGKVVAIPNHFGSGIPGYVVRPLMQARPNNTRGTNAGDVPQAARQPAAAPAPAPAPAQPTEGPGSDAGNGFKQGPKKGERYRVGVVAAAGGAVSLEKRLPAGTAATFYVGKDGNLIDGDSVNFIGDGKDRLWIPATPEQAQKAQAILDEMGRLELNDPARKDAKARLKALVQGKTTTGAPSNAADVARPGGQRADDRSGSNGAAGVPDQRPSDVLPSPGATAGQGVAGPGAAGGGTARPDALTTPADTAPSIERNAFGMPVGYRPGRAEKTTAGDLKEGDWINEGKDILRVRGVKALPDGRVELDLDGLLSRQTATVPGARQVTRRTMEPTGPAAAPAPAPTDAPTFTEGQRVQLAGQSYTVTTVNGS